MPVIQTNYTSKNLSTYNKVKRGKPEWNLAEEGVILGYHHKTTVRIPSKKHIQENVYISHDFDEKASWISPDHTIDLDNKSLILKRGLVDVYESISNSRELLFLEDGWDEEDALGCNKSTYNRAIEILVNYANTIYSRYNLSINQPEINLGRDGSIDLEWRSEDYILLINITNKENFEVHYYGEDFKEKTIIKGFIENFEINDFLAFWMRKLS
jgi:hypothetical protein